MSKSKTQAALYGQLTLRRLRPREEVPRESRELSSRDHLDTLSWSHELDKLVTSLDKDLPQVSNFTICIHLNKPGKWQG